MRVLVCGGRRFSDKQLMYRVLDRIHKQKPIDTVIEGNAFGADRIAGYWARSRSLNNIKFPADWAQYGRAAGPIRNKQMLDEGNPDAVVAFEGGKGTEGMVQLALSYGLPVVKVTSSGKLVDIV